MPHHRYLIVGGGIAADAAARGIRSLDEEGSIGLVGDEEDPPYDRPPLTKGLWKGGSVDDLWRGTSELDVRVALGRRIVRIDPDDGAASDDRGVIYTYDKLLLATGGRTKKLKGAPWQVIHLRTLGDYRRLRALTAKGKAFAVAGGGFIGPEIAAALSENGKEVTLLFPETGIGEKHFPEDLSAGLGTYFEARGVDVRPETPVSSVRRSGERLLVSTSDVVEPGKGTLRVDGMVAGLGIVPNQELAQTAGLTVAPSEEGGGIVVDDRLRTSHPRVWAAGDVAAVWSPALAKRFRSEHEDQANATGFHAGRSMAGSDESFDHVPYFYSDLFDQGFEAVGDVDAGLPIVQRWADGEPGALGADTRGVVYYLDDGRVRGVLLWNVRGRLRQARELVRSGVRHPVSGLRNAISLS